MPAMTEKIRIQTEKNWAGAVAFFIAFSGIIFGSLTGGLVGKYRATVLVEDCARQVLKGDICSQEVPILLGSIATGLSTGAIIGMIAGGIFYMTFSRRLKLARLPVDGLVRLEPPGKNGGTPEKA